MRTKTRRTTPFLREPRPSYQPNNGTGGEALGSGVRDRMEPGFAHDFTHVRIHADGAAAAAAAEYGARAYTAGCDIVFGAGEYRPGTDAGDFLLAHELAHVVQFDRRGGGPRAYARGVTAPGEAAEREASGAAAAAASGGTAEVSATPEAPVARFGWDDMFGLETAGNWLGDQAYSLVSDVGEQTRPDGSNPAVSAGVDMAKKGTSAMGLLKTATDFFTKELVPNAAGDGMVSQSNPLVSTAGTVLDVANFGLDVVGGKAEGQDWGESIFGAVGGLFGGKGGESMFAPEKGGAGSYVDAGINMLNSGLKLFGAPQEATDVSSMVADVTPSSFREQLGKEGMRGWWNIGEGISGTWDKLSEGDFEGALLDDAWSGLDKQVGGMKEGKSGAPLQGLAMLTDLIADTASGKDLESTIMQVGSGGQESSAARVGNWLGDEAYQFINQDLPEAAEFAAKDDSTTGRMLNWILN
jgi:hypothetical protein